MAPLVLMLMRRNCQCAQVQLHPHHLPLLVHLSGCVSAPSPSPGGQPAAKSGAQQQAPPAPPQEEGTAPAARSLIEGMLLPDTTAVATEFLSQSSWGYGPRAGGGQGAPRAPEGDEVRAPAVPPSSLHHLRCVPPSALGSEPAGGAWGS